MRTYPNSFSQFHFTKVKKVSINCFKGKSEFKESFSTWNKVLNRTETPKDSQGISAWRLRLFPRQQTFHLHSLSQFPESGASVFDPIIAGFLAPQDPAPSHFLIPVYRQYLFHIQPARVTHKPLQTSSGARSNIQTGPSHSKPSPCTNFNHCHGEAAMKGNWIHEQWKTWQQRFLGSTQNEFQLC